MAALAFAPLDQGTRIRLTEEQWAVASALTDLAALPPWVGPAAGPPAGPAGAAEPEPVELDDALAEALTLRSTALLEIEVAATAGDRGVLGVLWTDGSVGSALVRGVDVRREPPAASRPRPGIEVSAFPASRLLPEVQRLVPEATNSVGAVTADVPLELSVALGRALREGNGPVVRALTAELGLAEPPAVVDALARTMDGSLVITARSVGRHDVSAGSWLRCAAGWVELLRVPGDVVRHRPVTREDVDRTVLHDVAGRLGRALRAASPDDGPGPGEAS